MPTLYNDVASVYGTSDLYGQVISLAQNTNVRRTGLRVRVLDEQLNSWSQITNGLQGLSLATSLGSGPASSQTYYGYCLQMDMCVLGNGNIIRVRNGNGTTGNRQIYIQTITDPTNQSQWQSWTLLYSGTHYAVAVAPVTSSTYSVYHAKSDGLYKDNVKKISSTGTIVGINRVIGRTDAMYVVLAQKDSLDNFRYQDLKYVEDIDDGTWADDRWNYRWYRNDICAIELTDGTIARLQAAAFYTDPRDRTVGESIAMTKTTNYTVGENPNYAPLIIRGFASLAGTNTIGQPVVIKCSDGFYYMFYGENRRDADGDNSISISTVFWQRSQDLKYWSEPVAIGYTSMTPTNIQVVERSGYLYLANNGDAWRRPIGTVTTDISNWVPNVEMSIASVKEGGSATVSVANPNGIWDNLIDLTDRKITIEPAIQNADTGAWEYHDFGPWWIQDVQKQVNKNIRRLVIQCYDPGTRLANPLRDTYNFVGQVNWLDFELGRRNKLFNYYLRGGKSTFKTTTDSNDKITGKYYYCYRISKNHMALFTGWKGHNFDASIRFRGGSMSGKRFGIAYRWKDAKNYYWARVNGSTLQLIRVRKNVSTTLASYSIGSTPYNPTVRVVTEFGFHYIYLNGTLRITHNETTPSVYPGYVGLKYYSATSTTMGADRFKMSSWEINHDTASLVRTALAMGDFHGITVGDGGASQQFAVVWGPQSDLKSPLDALQHLLEEYKLELAWKNGQFSVGQFKSTDPVRSFVNDVYEFDVTERTGRRINLARVDGREDTYISIDGADSRVRGRQIVGYFDIPTLTTTEQVVARAIEEIRRGLQGTKYDGKSRMYFDVERMDTTTWYDSAGVAYLLRVEQMNLELSQGKEPHQNCQYILSPAVEP
jgi:hypothetical protein